MQEYERQSNAPPQQLITHQVAHNILNKSLYQKEIKRAKEMYQFPATAEQAQKHQKANRFGYRSSPSETANEKVCSCCGQSVHLQPASVCQGLQSSKERGEGDYGVPYEISAQMSMFFQLIKMVIIYLLLRLILIQGFQLWAIADSHLVTYNATLKTFNGITSILIWPSQRLASQQLYEIESFFNLFYIIVIIIFFSVYRVILKNFYDQKHYQRYNQDNYTILVENIPFFPFMKTQKEINNQKAVPYHQMLHIKKGQIDESQIVNTENTSIVISEALRLFFNKKAKRWREKVQRQAYDDIEKLNHNESKYYLKMREGKGDKRYEKKSVRSVTLCYDLNDIQKVKNSKERLMNEKIEGEAGAYLDKDSRNYVPNQIQMLAEKQIQIQKSFSTQMNPELTLSHFIGKAFISFEHEEIKNYFLQQHNSDLKLLYDDYECMKITQAPPVEEVNWFNMKVSTKKEIWVAILVAVVAIILVCFAWDIVFGLQFWRIRQGYANINFSNIGSTTVESNTKSIVQLFFIAVLVQIIRWLLRLYIEWAAKRTYFRTKGRLIYGKMLIKIIVYLLFLSTSAAIISEYFRYTQTSWDQITVVLTLFITFCMIIQTLTALIQLSKLFQIIKRCIYYSGESVETYQVKLNQMYELQEYDLSQRFSFYMVWLFIVSLSNSISPLILVIVVVLFILNFWIDKLNLVKRSSNLIGISKNLGTWMLRIMQWDILLFAYGNMLTLGVVYFKQAPNNDYNSYLSSWLRLNSVQMLFIAFLIAVVYKIVVTIVGWLAPERNEVTKSYSQTCSEFRYKYWNENPATRMSYEGRYQKPKRQEDLNNSTFIHDLYPNLSIDFLSGPQIGNEDPNAQPGANEEINLSKEYVGKKSKRSKNAS